MTPEEFRHHGHDLVDWIADTRMRIHAGQLPALSKNKLGDLRLALPAAAPQYGESFDVIMHDLERLILPACSHFQHPSFFAYFPSNHSLASVLGDYVSTGLAQLGLNWASSPALTELEQVTTDWFRQMLGLTDAWSGVIHDTASTSTLVALLCARERASGYSAAEGGLQGQAAALVVYASAQAHSSIAKAVLLAGYGRNNFRSISTDAEHALRTELLSETIETDLRAGLKPACIVATVGTTTTTAVDPLSHIAELARRYGIWLHVDAAMAGSAMVLPEYRSLWRGIESAESLVINPHKWLGAAFDCSTYFVRNPEYLTRVMSTNPSYLCTATDGEAVNYRDWGIPLGRRFRALKLWFLLREQGIEGLQGRLRRDIANAQWLKECVDSTPPWRRLAPVTFQTLCVVHEPLGLQGEGLDRHTLDWCRRINASGSAWLTPAMLDGRWMVRVSIGAEATERRHVMALWNLMQESARLE
jgi:aromatic-L-amino-acid/L-tryptophan decarboxylase